MGFWLHVCRTTAHYQCLSRDLQSSFSTSEKELHIRMAPELVLNSDESDKTV